MNTDVASPNMRVQRTRSSPSALRSPLTRHPLGRGILLWAIAMVIAVGARGASLNIPSCISPEAHLEAVEQAAQIGNEPRFRLTLRNPTARGVKVLDIRNGRRPDLEGVYFEVTVLQAGKPVNLSRPICDPGPVSERDFFTLGAGQSQQLILAGSCADLHQLKPGTYSARVILWLDPYASSATRCRSTDASFTIQK